jgi:D-alanine-D-alanine ligase
LVFLEVAVQPATEASPVPEPAAFAGVPFEELVRWMVEDTSLNR